MKLSRATSRGPIGILEVFEHGRRNEVSVAGEDPAFERRAGRAKVQRHGRPLCACMVVLYCREARTGSVAFAVKGARRMIGNKAWSAVLMLVSVVALPHCGSDDGGGEPSGNGGTGGASGSSGAAGTAGSGGGSAGAAGIGGQGGTGGGGTLCEQRCAATSSLVCPNDGSCANDCQAAIDFAPWCSDTMTAFVTCALEQPLENWICDTTGHSSLKEGICQAEAEAGFVCTVNGPPGGMPDLSAECASTCASMSGLSCAPANCEQTCNDSVANGPCAGAVGLVTVCGAGLSAADYDCDQGTPLPTGGKCADQVNLLVACLQAQ